MHVFLASTGPLNWLATSDPLTIVLYLIIFVGLGGGGGVGLYTAFKTNSRGVKGNALAEQANGITGLTSLTQGQDAFINSLQKQIDSNQKQIQDQADQIEIAKGTVDRLESKVDSITQRLEDEIEYSNILIRTLSENTIPIPLRKVKR